MFLLYFVLLAYLAVSSTLSGVPAYVSGRWVTDLDVPEYYDSTGEPPSVMENVFENYTDSSGLVTIEDQNFQTTPDSYLPLGEDLNDTHDSKVWKIVVITVILLMSLMGSLGTAYYLCIWRGGRIHYIPQKTYA